MFSISHGQCIFSDKNSIVSEHRIGIILILYSIINEICSGDYLLHVYNTAHSANFQIITYNNTAIIFMLNLYS